VPAVRIVGCMNPDSEAISEQLPILYRRVLDAVGRLHASGARREARRWRDEAIERYARAWDQATYRRLEELLARVESLEQARQQERANAA
jgi:hypothetical protein